MANIITMPQKGLLEESAVIAEWHVKQGESVKIGDLLFSIEIGKAIFEVESEAQGIVLEIIGKEGEEIAVKSPVCVIGEQGETYTLPVAASGDGQGSLKNDEPETSSIGERFGVNWENPGNHNGEVCISPRARQLALKKGIDYRFAQASGPEGRIIERDIESMLLQGPFVTEAARDRSLRCEAGSGLQGAVTTADIRREEMMESMPRDHLGAEYTLRPHSAIRKTIAQNMFRSIQGMAQLTINADFDATEVITLREKVKLFGPANGLQDISINDMIVFAAARILTSFPELNAHYDDSAMTFFHHVHMGFAVDTERGLMVPTIRNAHGKSLNEIAAESRDLASLCRKGEIPLEKLSGGTFTVSNLGMYGVTSFTPVINPPQTGLLGVCGIDWKVRMHHGNPEYYQAMGLSLTFDHRAVDGAPAARFLRALCEKLEKITLLSLK